MISYGKGAEDCVRSLGQSGDAILFAFDCLMGCRRAVLPAVPTLVSPVQQRLSLVAGGQAGSYATEKANGN